MQSGQWTGWGERASAFCGQSVGGPAQSAITGRTSRWNVGLSKICINRQLLAACSMKQHACGWLAFGFKIRTQNYCAFLHFFPRNFAWHTFLQFSWKRFPYGRSIIGQVFHYNPDKRPCNYWQFAGRWVNVWNSGLCRESEVLMRQFDHSALFPDVNR